MTRRRPSPLLLASSILASLLAACGESPVQEESPAVSQAWLREVMDVSRSRIESITGTPFLHPVQGFMLAQGSVDSLFLDLDSRGLLGSGEGPAWSLTERTMVSLGMVESLGVWRAARQAFDDGTVLGFYLPSTKSLYVFQDPDPVQLSHTVLHEMVHAWQDQRFDLDGLSAEVREADEDRAFTALVEGEAEYLSLAIEMGDPAASMVEDSLAANRLPLDTLARYLALWGANRGIPLSMTLPEYMPYIQGPDMVSRVRVAGGIHGLDSLFGQPPRSSREVLWTAPSGGVDDWNPGGCPAVAGDWRPLQTGRLGAVHLAALLHGSLSAGSGFQAVLGGWTGDRFWSFESDSGRPGLLWRLRFDDASGARAFASSFHRSRSARRSRSGLTETVDSADAHVAVDATGRIASVVRVSDREVAVAEGFPLAEAESLAAALFALGDRSPIAARGVATDGRFAPWSPPRSPLPIPPPRVFGR